MVSSLSIPDICACQGLVLTGFVVRFMVMVMVMVMVISLLNPRLPVWKPGIVLAARLGRGFHCGKPQS